ncbi:MAG: beta-lactamase family protein [bacterium]|nr:beta-lactamase family protein [bacterium]
MTMPAPRPDRRPRDFGAAAEVLEQAVRAGAFPGTVILVAQGGEIVWHAAFGHRSLDPERMPMRPDMVFDLASLTKPLATTVALMRLVRDGKVRLDDRITRFVPNFGVHGKTHVTIRQVLCHASGLAAWRPFFKDVQKDARHGRLNYMGSQGARQTVYERIHRERLEYDPGTRAVYSDLGFILLGELIELLSHASLDRVCHDRIFRPLGLGATGFVDLSKLRVQKLVPVTEMIAPTERCPWRGKVLCGEVHDDNAWAIGGVAGHSGLFSTAMDVHTLLARLRACLHGDDDFLPAALVREMWTRETSVPGSTWALGWDTPSATGSSAGARVSRHAVGHLGFTGTSVWVDLERDAHVVFLTNRVHPTRNNEKIREVRPRIHDAIWAALDA